MNWLKSTILNKNFWFTRYSYDTTPSELSVTIVIPAWNEEDFIGDTIKSIMSQTYPCEIIVVDDSSTDSTKEIAETYGVKVITTDVNQGSKSQALNYSLPHIDTDIFICVDADTVLKKNSVENLMKAFNDDNTMVACGFVLSKNKQNFWESARYGEYIAGQSIVKSAQQNANFVLVASGCFFGIRTPFLKKHKFNDRTMAEDMDLTWVAIENGHRVTFVEDAYCYVSDPDNMKTYDKQVSRWYRGLFQNIKERNFNLFTGSLKLGLVAYSYILMNLVGIPMIIILTILFPHIIAPMVFWISVMFMIVAFYGIKRGENVLSYPKHFINYIVIMFFTYYIFVRSLIQELILGKKLDKWIKGH